MAKKSAKKKPASKRSTKKDQKRFKISDRFKSWTKKLTDRRKKLQSRRPHRSFRMTARRDYKRSMKMPGYWSLTVHVLKFLNQHKWLFVRLIGLYFVLTMFLASVVPQETYSELRDVIDNAREEGDIGSVGSAVAAFVGVVTSQFVGASIDNPTQQIASLLIGLFAWLTTIWLVRNILAGKKVKVRDGVYSSGGPVAALATLTVVMIIQSLPAVAAYIFYNAANASGLFDQTATLMLFGGGAALLTIISLYWITGTLMAFVVATLPGMYPMRAITLAGDIVVGRRIRVLLRLVWAMFLVLLVWAIVLGSAILFDSLLKSSLPDLEWLPFVPIVSLLLTSFTVIFMATYTYLFYRKVIEDDSAPA